MLYRIGLMAVGLWVAAAGLGSVAAFSRAMDIMPDAPTGLLIMGQGAGFTLVVLGLVLAFVPTEARG